MLKTTAFALSIVLALGGCSKKDADLDDTEGSAGVVKGSETAMPIVEKAVRVWTHGELTIDLVAAELEGVVMARTSSQAIMHYPGYRIILTTPGNIVTRIVFQFDPEARPSVYQMTELYGMPEPTSRGMLYTYESEATGQKIHVLARTEVVPATESTRVTGLIIEGARVR